MEDLRNLFPVTNTYTYLNTAASGLLSTDLAKWRSGHELDFVQNGSLFRDSSRELLDSVRVQAARFFEANLNEIALVPNFSFGLNILLEGIPKGKKVLLLQQDYPSINWAFEYRNFDVCFAEINENLEQNIETAVARHRPDIFAFSIVQYLNGVKIDFDFLKQLKAYHPNILLLADGTQYLGTEPFSFAESPIDIVGASSYKWLLSGYGNGVFMVKEAAQQHIRPKMIGFNSANADVGNKETIPFMKHFEPGHLDTFNYGSLGQSLQFFEDFGIHKISTTLKKLCGKAKEGFSERGLLDTASEKRDTYSTIFTITGDEVLFQKLKKENIICSQRGNGIRISFHMYNNETDLETLLYYL